MRKFLIAFIIYTSLTELIAMPTKDDSSFKTDPVDYNFLIHKQFYTHSGPEPPSERKITVGKALKNFRVIFVNIPSPYEKLRQKGLKALKVSLAPVEEKLAVYVLNAKKNRQQIELVNFEAPPPTPATAPEVHFVKYNDQQDMEDVQLRITDQYLNLDSL